MSHQTSTDYGYNRPDSDHTEAYLWAPVVNALVETRSKTLFDVGRGNGAFARYLTDNGFSVTGVDPSVTGIEQSRKVNPQLRLEVGSAYEPLASRFGTFPALISLEVVEHLYDPRSFARCVADLLEAGGTAIISSPYHSYLKNLVLAATGKLDAISAHYGIMAISNFGRSKP